MAREAEEINNESNSSLKEEEIDPCPLQYGYRISVWRCILFYPLAILPACIGLLIAYWYPYWWIRFTCCKCDLDAAQFVTVQDLDLKWKVEIVRRVSMKSLNSSSSSSSSSSSCSSSDEGSDESSPLITSTPLSYILHRHLRYLYDSVKGKYFILRGLESGLTCNDIHNYGCGLESAEHNRRIKMYGENSIEVPVKPYHVLFVEEVLHPFYIFQILSIIFWMADQYLYYAGAVLLIFVVSMLVSLIQTKRHMQRLHDMVKTSGRVSVLRDKQILHDVSSEELVPGDVMIVPPEGMMLTCDAALITGSAIVNEAMLTGESVPVTKTGLPLDDSLYTPVTHKMHTLFSGTQVVQARYYSQQLILAVVVRTGFLTAKGGMVRSILYPKPLNIKFYWDSIKFILLLSVLAAIGFIYTILVLQLKKPRYIVSETIFRAFDIITTIVPPSLPAAITIGTVYAVNRLRKNKIYCISPQRVNLCGKVKLVCFDKTGTLTEDSLDLLGVQPVINRKLQELIHDVNDIQRSSPFIQGMACCHSLTRIHGNLTGDPLDFKMFQSTGWCLEEPGEDITRFDTLRFPIVRPRQATPTSHSSQFEAPTGIELGILKQFTFSSELQRMSVLVRQLPSDSRILKVFTKGAPEMIKSLSRKESVPSDYDTVLSRLTSEGYRVLAIGYKEIKKDFHHAMRLERGDLETDLLFCGFIVFENRLKVQTSPTLWTLRNSAIRTVMITGDNLLTAVAVARNCSMIQDDHNVILLKATPTSDGSPLLSYQKFEDKNNELQGYTGYKYSIQTDCVVSDTFKFDYFHIAIDGNSYTLVRQHFPTVYQRLLVSGTVFARMSPLNKKQLVSDLMTLGYGVAMCGDGANDCGALKAAHVGISLSESEASVASPFTSSVSNITCVPVAIKEGRAALVTSFSVFKFMALYSLTEFTSVAILYSMESNLGDLQYLFIDLVLILTFAFVMGLTGPYPYIVKRRPLGTLAGIHVFSSIIIQTVLMIIGQLGMYYYLKSEPWYIPFVPNPTDTNISCHENTVIFTSSIFQYIILVMAFSKGAPYRKPIYTNVLFMLSFAILIPICLYFALAPPTWFPWLWKFLQLEPIPHFYFRITLVTSAGIHLLLAYLIEGYLLPSNLIHKLFRLFRCKKKPRNLYKRLLLEIESDSEWPPSLPNGISAHC